MKMNNLFRLETLDAQIKKLQAERKELVTSIIDDHIEQIQYGKSKTIKSDGYKIVFKSTITTKLDKDGINEAYETIDDLPIRTKYELDKRAYDAMQEDQRAIFDEFITTNEAKSLTYERITE
jgi:hypothetical protein